MDKKEIVDDSTLLGKTSLPNNRNNVASSITLDLDKLNNWGSQNLVSFNANKTQCCLITKSKNKNLPDILYGSNILKMSVHVGLSLCLGMNIFPLWRNLQQGKSASYSGPSDFSLFAPSHPLQGPNPHLSRIRLSSVERSL